MKNKGPLNRLKHHVTGAIERGEKEAIVAVTSKSLPGPWKAHTRTSKDGTRHHYIADCINQVVAEISERRLSYDNETIRANIALIAAAPEMLAALKLALDSFERYTPKSDQIFKWSEVIRTLRETMAKAENETR